MNRRATPIRTKSDASVRWLREQKSKALRGILGTVALGLASGLLLIAQAWCLAGAVNAIVIGGGGLSQAMPWLWTMLVVLSVRAVLGWLSEQTAFHAAARIKEGLRQQLFRRLRALGPVYLSGERSGALSSALVEGVEALDRYYAEYLPQLALAALVPLSVLGFVLRFDWRIALILGLSGPLIPFFMVFIGKGAERLSQKQWRKLARMSAHFLDVLQGLTTLKLFNVSRLEADVVARISDDYRRSVMSVLRVAFLSSLALEFFSTMSIALAAVLLGFQLLWGRMDFRPAFFILLLAPEFFLPLRKLGSGYHARMEAVGAVEKIVEVLNAPAPAQAAETLQAPPRAQETCEPPAIAFEGVHFSYDGLRRALADFNLRIEPGESVALVGASGAGKTTVLNLLLGFIRPGQGEIFVNGIGLHRLKEEDWLSHVAWVPQRPRMFHGTVAENIRMGRPGADGAQVEEAARLAQADQFIRELPLGYETPVGEGGRALSGGQRQLIAIARAFLKDAPLVLLDEATANLDSESQAGLQQTIARLSEGRTMLMIAHRLSTVRLADRIAVLDRGGVAEEGAHDALLHLNGFYARMVKAYRRAA